MDLQTIKYIADLGGSELVAFLLGLVLGFGFAMKFFCKKEKQNITIQNGSSNPVISQTVGTCSLPLMKNNQIVDYHNIQVVITYENSKPVRVGCPYFNKGKCELAKTVCEVLNKQI
ncbi:hypothetical protein [Campylobacter pinnipediorum]|uniref:Uncharacterized protein n=1 Tax=Campylobacter pinnipediorum subsp. pinnipediorum TaxID=1660067 RepID=A0AAX0L9E3_9BACT|nr:hypothetical protein [Campylobacter pinnipediorum]OPA77358.1 hypothetical protein BFG04_04490 [Campylobacter pinnipediorum subsp. pinnipediorum]